jgi:hypothetical protein
VDERGNLHFSPDSGEEKDCSNLITPDGSGKDLRFGVLGKQVHLHRGKDRWSDVAKDCLEATATKMTREGVSGERLILQGNARVRLAIDGERTEVSAERIALDLQTGACKTSGITGAIHTGESLEFSWSLPELSWFWFDRIITDIRNVESEREKANQIGWYIGFFR